jgi:hypothetical protein
MGKKPKKSRQNVNKSTCQVCESMRNKTYLVRLNSCHCMLCIDVVSIFAEILWFLLIFRCALRFTDFNFDGRWSKPKKVEVTSVEWLKRTQEDIYSRDQQLKTCSAFYVEHTTWKVWKVFIGMQSAKLLVFMEPCSTHSQH